MIICSEPKLHLANLRGFARRSQEGPVTGRNGIIILSDSHGNRTWEDVQGELLNPLVPITLVELMTICRMSEESRSLTHFRSQSLIECSKSTRSKLLPDSKVPIVDFIIGTSLAELAKDSHLGHNWSGDCCYTGQLLAGSYFIISTC